MYKQVFPTPQEHSKGLNTCEFIVVHHTWTKEWTVNWVIDWLFRREDYASCHYLIDINWDIYKFWNDTDILWHAWESQWKWKKDLNKYSIGIEIIWPLSNGWFTWEQSEALWLLVSTLSEKHNIKQENVLRHKDICVPVWRKVDPADTLWNRYFPTWESYVKFLFTKRNFIMSTKEFAKLQGFELSTSSEKDYETPATVWDVKDLLEVLLYRYHTQNESGTLKIRTPKV